MLGDKYDVQPVKKLMLTHLHATLNAHNASDMAILAHLHQEKKLEEAALKTIKKNLQTVKDTEGWQLIEDKYPKLLTRLLLLFAEQQQQHQEELQKQEQEQYQFQKPITNVKYSNDFFLGTPK